MRGRGNRVLGRLLAVVIGLGVWFSAAPAISGTTTTAMRCEGADAAAPAEAPRWLAPPGDALVVVGEVNLRAGPGTDCPIYGSLEFGTVVQIVDELLHDGEHLWRRVLTPIGDGFTIASAYQSLPATAPAGVPVLMYHHIDESGGRYAVSPAMLDAQLAWLRDNGYVSITPRDLYNARYHGMPLPARPVMLTIDDGHASTRTFKGLLDAYGFRGVYFLPNYTPLTPEDMVALADSGEVCGHTVSHPFLEDLDYAGQWAEIADNKAWLEGIVGQPVTCFAYPFGSHNGTTDQVLADAGHLIAFNAWGGIATVTPDADPYHVLRMEVYGSYDLQAFIDLVTIGGW